MLNAELLLMIRAYIGVSEDPGYLEVSPRTLLVCQSSMRSRILSRLAIIQQIKKSKLPVSLTLRAFSQRSGRTCLEAYHLKVR
jgi:hypothetical protein